MPSIATQNGFKAIVVGEQREGLCENCNTQTVKEFYYEGTDIKWLDNNAPPTATINPLEFFGVTHDYDLPRKRVHMVCPKCGGQGKLIARTYAIQAPHLKSLKFKDVRQFILENEYCNWLSKYHTERVEYATKHRHKYMPEKYRSGEPSPQNIKQCIRAIIGLKLEKIRR